VKNCLTKDLRRTSCRSLWRRLRSSGTEDANVELIPSRRFAAGSRCRAAGRPRSFVPREYGVMLQPPTKHLVQKRAQEHCGDLKQPKAGTRIIHFQSSGELACRRGPARAPDRHAWHPQALGVRRVIHLREPLAAHCCAKGSKLYPRTCPSASGHGHTGRSSPALAITVAINCRSGGAT
jgi:hypothetical protein